jgi:uncharacterized protein involved in tolerance to divalent cations
VRLLSSPALGRQTAPNRNPPVTNRNQPTNQPANDLSDALVSSKLAACVNIVPGLTSVYWWEGKVNRDSELLLVVKSKGALLGELTSEVG